MDPDADHDRTVVTAVASSGEPLLGALLAGVAAAVGTIDIRRQRGLHPRLGAADVVPLAPLGSADLDQCVELAWELGRRIWEGLGVPVFWYGRAARRPEARRLSAIRSGDLAPDLGTGLHPSAGAVCVGARPLLVAYNLNLAGVSAAEARGLAGRLRESGGGLPGLQALIFELPSGSVQLSMNLTDPMVLTPADVRAELKKLEIRVLSEQIVGLCPAAAALGTAAAAGRILEARLAAAAAQAAHQACELSSDAERRLLGRQLLGVAAELAAVRPQPDEFLAAAEQAAALSRVLAAAGLLTDQLRAAFQVAAVGLRRALGDDVQRRFRERLDLLDRWLAGS